MRKLTDAEARSGYIKEFGFNPNWKKQQCICGYEHCIELMPHEGRPRSKKSCFIFGHNCPGGEEMVKKCITGKNRIVPKERIVEEDRDFFERYF